jgi:hypothetical protein
LIHGIGSFVLDPLVLIASGLQELLLD